MEQTTFKIVRKDGFAYINGFCIAPGCRAVAYEGRQIFDCTKLIALILSYLLDHLEHGIVYVPHSEVLLKIGERRFDKDCDDDEDTFDPPLRLKTEKLRDLVKTKKGVPRIWGTFIKSTGCRDAKLYLDFSWKPETNLLFA